MICCNVWNVHGDCFELSDQVGSERVIDVAPSARPWSRHPRSVVLTHDDWDHIGGASTYLRSLSPGRGELWVPYEWGVIDRELSSPGMFDARDDPTVVEDEPSEGWWRAREGDRAIESDSAADQDHLWNADPDEVAARVAMLPSVAVTRGIPKEICERAMKTADSVRTIIKDAHNLRWRVRYFNHCYRCGVDHWRYVGDPGLLTLVNAVEMFLAPPPPKGSFVMTLAVAALTVQNRRALALHAPDGDDGGMLFWSDSKGPSGHTVPRTTVATAPHHGSDNTSHLPAWNALPIIPFVISTYHWAVRGPAPRFTSQHFTQRSCVMCWNVPTALGGCPRGPVLSNLHIHVLGPSYWVNQTCG